VPAAFERHVREAVPQAEHVTLDCGHIPQVERPKELHAAIGRFLARTDRWVLPLVHPSRG